MKGYEALRQAAAWSDISTRGRIRATGEDRVRLLHAMTTNNVQALLPGQGCYAFFLSAQGRILGDVHVLCREDDLLLDTEPESSQKLYEHLDKFIIVDDVTLEDWSGVLAAIALEGPRAAAILTQLGAPLPEKDYAHVAWGDRILARLSRTGGPGYFIFSPAAEREALIAQLQAAGAEEADDEAVRVVRLEHGKPRYGEDISERFLTQEANQMHAVSFNKGCYLGQEIVERVRSRAQIHRRLLPLRIEGSAAPAAGTKIGGAEITSAAHSPALGHIVGLGYVRSENAPGAVLTEGGLSATVLPAPSPVLESCP